jgi:hypothetical protein
MCLLETNESPSSTSIHADMCMCITLPDEDPLSMLLQVAVGTSPGKSANSKMREADAAAAYRDSESITIRSLANPPVTRISPATTVANQTL